MCSSRRSLKCQIWGYTMFTKMYSTSAVRVCNPKMYYVSEATGRRADNVQQCSPAESNAFRWRPRPRWWSTPLCASHFPDGLGFLSTFSKTPRVMCVAPKQMDVTHWGCKFRGLYAPSTGCLLGGMLFLGRLERAPQKGPTAQPNFLMVSEGTA